MLQWIGRLLSLDKKKVNGDDVTQFREEIGIDISGPEFFDYHPTTDDIAAHLRASKMFRDDDIEWMASLAHEHLRGGGSGRKATERIVRSGSLIDEDAVTALGFHRKKKIGDRFASALAANDPPAATERLEQIIHVASSRASQLHNLRRMAEAGIKTVMFASARDERSTTLERELEGKTLTIDEARALAIDHAEEISRSMFRPNVTFGD